MVPIPLNAFKKIIIAKENYYIVDNEPFSCDLMNYVEPVIEIKNDEIIDSLEMKKYELPKGFNIQKAILIENVNIKDSGVCGC